MLPPGFRAQSALISFKILPKRPKTLPNPSKISPKTLPTPSQNPLKIAILSKKITLRFRDPFWTAKCCPKPPQEAPKPARNRWKIDEKSMWKNACFLKPFFSRFFSIFDLKIHRFFYDFWMLLAVMYGKHDYVKIELPPAREHDFSGFEHVKNM